MRKQANTRIVIAAITAAAVELPADAREYLIESSAFKLKRKTIHQKRK